MDDAMMRIGGEIKRKELVAMFGDLNINEDRSKMTEEELKIATAGDDSQAEKLTA